MSPSDFPELTSYTRGSPISSSMSLIKVSTPGTSSGDKIYLEVCNESEGECTFNWLLNNSDRKWYGTNGKPDNWNEGTFIDNSSDIQTLIKSYETKVP